MAPSSLVSIVIPAYKPQFFEKALLSAMNQDYEHVEIVICDDCRDEAVFAIVERCRPLSPFPIRYFHNEQALLEPGNLARGILLSRGEYIKFLYDDDLLMPGAVRHLLAALQQHPRAVMATCKRLMIDPSDKPCGESILTLFPFVADVIVDGKELASFLGEHIYNFIGEPTSVMCRRQDVLPFGADIMSLQGEVMYWLGDVAMYVKLLQQGDLIMLAEPLACFRISVLQTSQVARDNPLLAAGPYARYRTAMAALGWMRESADNRTVKVSVLADPLQSHELRLADYFSSGGKLSMGNRKLQAWSHPDAVPQSAKTLPVVLAYPIISREGHESRVIAPLQAMLSAGLINGALHAHPISQSELRRMAPDVVVFQDDLGPLPLEAMRQARSLEGVMLVLEVHAFLSTSPSDPQPDPVVRWADLQQAASMVDRIVVPSRALVDAFAPLHADVQLVETRLSKEWLDLPFRSQALSRPRIGCCIEMSNSLDGRLLEDVIRALADDVEWVLWGGVPLALRVLAHEVLEEGLQCDPQRLAGLELDLALAPLGTSGLDSCRSELALLQLGACGYNVICSDTPAYDNGLPVTRVGNSVHEWLSAIELHLAFPLQSRLQGESLRQRVRDNCILDDANARVWARAWLPT
ncbi:glycosyltransferase [Pseudomonas shirazensis]|uniref:Glycosyltransferase n=1 Tax=Pseudomonas shirazensis TaxID=2745494 RepID=A0ABU8ZYG0_9PSED